MSSHGKSSPFVAFGILGTSGTFSSIKTGIPQSATQGVYDVKLSFILSFPAAIATVLSLWLWPSIISTLLPMSKTKVTQTKVKMLIHWHPQNIWVDGFHLAVLKKFIRFQNCCFVLSNWITVICRMKSWNIHTIPWSNEGDWEGRKEDWTEDKNSDTHSLQNVDKRL